MNYRQMKPNLGDVIAISKDMSLRFEKVAEDIAPVWFEIPYEPSTMQFNDGCYLKVTNDLWFVFEDDHWRVMTQNEHKEAFRQTYLSEGRGQSSL